MINFSFQSPTYYCESDQDGGGRVGRRLAEVAAAVVLRHRLDLELPVLQQHCRQDTTSGLTLSCCFLAMRNLASWMCVESPMVRTWGDLSDRRCRDHVTCRRKLHTSMFLLTGSSTCSN